MLSGFALPKSLLGNAGASVEAAVERGSMAPIKSMFSKQTVEDAIAAFKNHRSVGPTPGVNLPGPMPGRFMGAFDDAAQKALVRGGDTAEQAANRVLQTPLGTNFGNMGKTLEGPVSSYLHPFRRTPFNQFIEGVKAMNRVGSQTGTRGERLATSVAGATGAVHGAATADDKAPMSLPIAIAAAGRQGYPYGVAALLARHLMGSKSAGGVPGAVLPVSEYGLDSSIGSPLRPLYHPAALTALERIIG